MSIIRFTGSATSWLECLPLGDGRLGAMTDGGVSETTLHLNDATAWSGSPASETTDPVPDAAACAELLARARERIAAGDHRGAEAPLQAMQTRYAQSYLPLGTVRIRTVDAGALSPVVRELDLLTGVHSARADAHRTTTFITATHSVLVHVLEPAVPVEIDLQSPLRGLSSTQPESRTPDADTQALLVRLPSDVAPGHEPDLPAATWSDDPGASLQAAITVRVLREKTRTVVLVTTATTFRGLGEVPTGTAEDALRDALSRIDAAAEDGSDALLAEHEASMREMLGGVTLSFDGPDAEPTAEVLDTAQRFAAARSHPDGVLAGDPDLAALLFHYGRYLLVSSSRPGGMTANLQGIWNAEMQPPWGSGYTLNINTPMNYWGAHVTGLSERALPLRDLTVALSTAARGHTARLYGAPGWTVHHNTDIWLYATTPGRGAGDPRWSFWPLGGAWLASELVEAWEFGAASADDLAAIWPALRGAAEFALHWHRDGLTSPATSPENAFLAANGSPASLVTTTTMDQALLRRLFEAIATASRVLDIDDDVTRAARERLADLPVMPAVADDGTLVEWDTSRVAEDPRHRHVSGLFGLFPGTENWDDETRAAAVSTLERRGDDSSGWSLVWKLALWARLGRGDRVADLLELSLRDADEVSGPWAGGLYPNLFAAHPPFQIDANLGFVGALAEALLQSDDGIRLLPAVPAALDSGRVTGLVARPGIRVDVRWQAGRLVDATLRATTPAAAGAHRVHWQGHTLTVTLDTAHDTTIDARSFPTQEVHP
ncbi:MAG: glycosyl hydrolase family 95 catalytic domain-containing protein [Actinomycetota bacterium]